MQDDFAYVRDAQLQKRFWNFVVAIIVMFVLLSVLAGLEVFTGFSMIPGPRFEKSMLATVMIYVAIATILFLASVVWYWRDRSILLRGIVVTAEVVKFGVSSIAEIPETTVRYTIDGREFESKIAFGDNNEKSFDVGSKIDVIVDKDHRNRCTPFR